MIREESSSHQESCSLLSARAVAVYTESLDADLCKPGARLEPGWSGAGVELGLSDDITVRYQALRTPLVV